MKKITKEMWLMHLSHNSYSSYGMVVDLAILMLWEAGIKDKEEAFTYLVEQGLGLSGAQAEMAVAMATTSEPDGWLDESMSKVRRNQTEAKSKLPETPVDPQEGGVK